MYNDRFKNNKDILEVISYFVNHYPDWRFHQILQNIGVTTREGGDMFYEESIDTFKRVNSIIDVEMFKSLNN